MSDETKKVDDGGPAFPGDRWQKGMSLRDWYAGMALQGIVGSPHLFHYDETIFVEIAYKSADAMIARRKW